MSEHVLAEQRRYYAERAPEYDDWWYKRGSDAGLWTRCLVPSAAAVTAVDANPEAFARNTTEGYILYGGGR